MRKVLIIDDDEGVRLTLAHILGENGYEPFVAAGGFEGVKSARECRPDIVLTDLLMPQQDGFETMSMLRQEIPNLKIVAMSGGKRMGRGDILQSALMAGADEVLAKPFDVPVLLDLLRRI